MEEIWEVENIPGNDNLYRRVHFQMYNSKNPDIVPPSAFKNSPENDKNLSTDWSKYTTPKGVHDLIAKQYKANKVEFKNPNDFFILTINVQKIIDLNIEQTVEHTPIQNIPEQCGNPNNRAHASIIGEKTTEEIRLKLSYISSWILKPNRSH